MNISLRTTHSKSLSITTQNNTMSNDNVKNDNSIPVIYSRGKSTIATLTTTATPLPHVLVEVPNILVKRSLDTPPSLVETTTLQSVPILIPRASTMQPDVPSSAISGHSLVHTTMPHHTVDPLALLPIAQRRSSYFSATLTNTVNSITIVPSIRASYLRSNINNTPTNPLVMPVHSTPQSYFTQTSGISHPIKSGLDSDPSASLISPLLSTTVPSNQRRRATLAPNLSTTLLHNPSNLDSQVIPSNTTAEVVLNYTEYLFDLFMCDV